MLFQALRLSLAVRTLTGIIGGMIFNFFRFIVLSILISIFSSCADSKNNHMILSNDLNSSSQIINGRPVLKTDLYARHTVAVAPAGGLLPCTGVLVSEKFILSAGHCATYFAGGEIFFGLEAKPGKAIVYKIKNITLHPKYCNQCTGYEDLFDVYDLALVEFEGRLPDGFAPVKIASRSQIDKGLTVHLAGYGADENYKYDLKMKVTQVSVIRLGTTEFLTDETKSGSCSGDSGGPAFIVVKDELLLAGVTSRGDPRCRAEGVYTLAPAHIDWINSIILGP